MNFDGLKLIKSFVFARVLHKSLNIQTYTTLKQSDESEMTNI